MTAQTPSTTKSSSRRALLAGALGGLGAWAASAVGRAAPVRAEGETMVVGGEYYTATSTTGLGNSANSSTVFYAEGAGGVALKGFSQNNNAVWGSSVNDVGVLGYTQATDTPAVAGHAPATGTGVQGYSGAFNARPAAKPKTGVFGSADQDANSRGVWGSSDPGIGVLGQSNSSYGVLGTSNYIGVSGSSGSGEGVRGTSSSGLGIYGYSASNVGIAGTNASVNRPALQGWAYAHGTGVQGFSGDIAPGGKPKTGVYGSANQDANARGVWGYSGKGVGVYGQANRAGIALRASGRIKADKVSGVATIAAGNTSVTVNPGVNVTGSSFVLLTPKVNLGGRDLWFATNATADTITIRISSSRSSNTKIAWLLLG